MKGNGPRFYSASNKEMDRSMTSQCAIRFGFTECPLPLEFLNCAGLEPRWQGALTSSSPKITAVLPAAGWPAFFKL